MLANHLPRIRVLNGNSDSTGCVHGGREEYAIILSFFIHLCFLSRLSAAPIYKGDTVGLRRGRRNWRRLSAAECEGVQRGPRSHGC